MKKIYIVSIVLFIISGWIFGYYEYSKVQKLCDCESITKKPLDNSSGSSGYYVNPTPSYPIYCDPTIPTLADGGTSNFICVEWNNGEKSLVNREQLFKQYPKFKSKRYQKVLGYP